MKKTVRENNEAFPEVSFYIVAHADDWQLFMQPNAYKDIVSQKSEVVFIVTTAGDAGADETYWYSREEGMKSSIRLCLAPLGNIAETTGTCNFHGHIISYWSINNATCYFLRLPDGNLDSNGFVKYQHQSLFSFRTGNILSITAVDNSTTYKNWNDFVSTLDQIIEIKSDGIFNKWINYLNPAEEINPHDHPDHICTGQAIQEMKVISSLKQVLFIGYSTAKDVAGLNSIDLFWKSAMFAAYEKAVFDNSGYSTLREGIPVYLKWCLSSPKFNVIQAT